MRVQWDYACDFGHQWSFFRDEHAEERPQDRFCPEGHEYVTLHKARPADLLSVMLRPVAFVDEVTGKVRPSDTHFAYRILLVDREDREVRTSERGYELEEALELAKRFLGREKERALLLWDRKPL
jgi:hypothetical protein